MPNYIRLKIAGGSYFFTAVTASRMPFLDTDLSRSCLREAIEEVRQKRPFEMFSVVLLPDHWHGVWNLPPGDDDFSMRWSLLKRNFTERYLDGGGSEVPISPSRRKKGERGVWHRRFYEHLVRGEEELKRIVDYIHWNPRKHKMVSRVADWPWSSFHRFASVGEYTINWGGEAPIGFEADIFKHDL